MPVWRAPEGFQVDAGFVAAEPLAAWLCVVVVVVLAAVDEVAGGVVSQPASAAAIKREVKEAR